MLISMNVPVEETEELPVLLMVTSQVLQVPRSRSLKQHAFEAKPRHIFVIIPAVMRVPAAVIRMTASTAVFRFGRKIFPEERKAVLPDIAESGFPDISLDRLGPALNIQTGPHISVGHDAGCIDPCVAEPVPVPQLSFQLRTEIMTAAVFHRIPGKPFFADEGKQASANADMYQQALSHPEKALYWKLTIEFGRMYEKMQREWCKYCIGELEKLQHMTEAGNYHDSPAIAKQEEIQ